jgi:acid phosphatase (class A)
MDHNVRTLMTRPAVLLGFFLCLCAPAVAGGSAQAKSVTLQVLSPQDIEPLRLLAPPPPHGSSGEAAELKELHDLQDHRTPERLAQAQWDQDHQNWTLYVATLGPVFDLAQLPATARVLTVVQQDNTIAVGQAKTAFKRMRPWAADATIHGCTIKSSDDPMSSYPSGHADVGYALGVTLAYLMPDKAQAILARASDYAYSRMVCGMHFHSDTVAGQVLATALTVQMLHSPELRSDLEAARAELKAAGL